MISERTKAGLARSDKKHYNPMRSKAFLRRIIALSNAAKQKSALERAVAYRMHIEWALSRVSANGVLASFHALRKVRCDAL